MDDLWEDAAEDHGRIARQAALALADAELEAVMPFLLASRSASEYAHRSYLAQESIRSIAARCGLDEAELMATARRRYELYRQALAEGVDVMTQLEHNLDGSGYGSGAEVPDMHQEGFDLQDSYSEVPTGHLTGPSPDVTRPRPPAVGPVQEATGSLRPWYEAYARAGQGMRRTADASPDSMMTQPYSPTPPDTGVGTGATDISTPSSPGGMSPSLPAGVGTNGDDTVPITPPGIGQVTSRSDPVRRKVASVAQVVAATNPGLPRAECERVARLVVGRYLRTADLTDSVMSDAPMSSGDSGGGSGGSSGGGGGGAFSHMLEGQGLRSMIPGMGGGGGGGAAAGEGAASLAEEAAPLLAL